MKNTRLNKVVIFAILLAINIGCKEKKNYIINGSFNGPIKEEWIYKVKVLGDYSTRDSAKIVDGKFKFEGRIDIPEVYAFHLPIDKMNGAATGFIEPGEMELRIDLQDWYGGSKISGGELNDEYNRLKEFIKNNYWTPIDELEQNLKFPINIDPETINDSIERLEIAQLQYVLNYVDNHLTSPIAIQLLYKNELSLTLEELGSYIDKIGYPLNKTIMFKTLVDEYQTQLELQKEFDLEPKSSDMEVFQDLIDGEKLLDELVSRNKGKALYLNFWGTFCGPCKQEFPYINKLYNEIDTSQVQFIHLCISSPKNEWLDLINSESLKGQHYILDNDNLKRFNKKNNVNFNGVPRFIIVNKQGVIEQIDAPRANDPKIADILNSL